MQIVHTCLHSYIYTQCTRERPYTRAPCAAPRAYCASCGQAVQMQTGRHACARARIDAGTHATMHPSKYGCMHMRCISYHGSEARMCGGRDVPTHARPPMFACTNVRLACKQIRICLYTACMYMCAREGTCAIAVTIARPLGFAQDAHTC